MEMWVTVADPSKVVDIEDVDILVGLESFVEL